MWFESVLCGHCWEKSPTFFCFFSPPRRYEGECFVDMLGDCNLPLFYFVWARASNCVIIFVNICNTELKLWEIRGEQMLAGVQFAVLAQEVNSFDEKPKVEKLLLLFLWAV